VLKFEHANGNEVTWSIPNLQTGKPAEIDRRFFDAPKAPPGWKLVAGDTRPREPTVRPSGGGK
jgi:hypothetical protein